MNDDIKCVNCGNVDPFTQLTLCETCGRHIARTAEPSATGAEPSTARNI